MRNRKDYHTLLRDLGIANFETEATVQRLQTRMIARLRHAGVNHSDIIGLTDCTVDKCGRKECSEACYFATYRRRLREIPAAFKLVSNHEGPVCLVRVARSAWVRPVGELATVSIDAIKQLNRRALDDLYNLGLVAVGTVMVHFQRHTNPAQWVAGIQQVVAGATNEELEQAYSIGASGELSNIICGVREVTNLGQAISTALRRSLLWHKTREPKVNPGEWHTVRPADMVSPQPDADEWAEYYQWLTSLRSNVRLLRYGCDRYFNKLTKQSRPFRWRPRKKHPYPYWLAPWQFGNHPYDCTCRACRG
jgi:hypothetical protein